MTLTLTFSIRYTKVKEVENAGFEADLARVHQTPQVQQ